MHVVYVFDLQRHQIVEYSSRQRRSL